MSMVIDHVAMLVPDAAHAITYTVVKHPRYTAVALVVLPWIGFLLNTWFTRWDAYRRRVKLPWA